MRQSQLFTKTRRNAPKDEVSKNADLLIRAGFVHKEMAGVYSYLPLGLRVLEKIKTIVREEMNAIGGQEVLLTTLQDKSLWEKTGRWNDETTDNWFKTALKSGTEIGLALTHEEPLTAIMAEYISSYRDLPKFVYQFQTKFRNELRAKSGIMRGREFLMKDMYSFARTPEEHRALYTKAREAYVRVFDRLGLGAQTHLVFASGGIFSKYSEEFQAVCDAGEDDIYLDAHTGQAVNKEVLLPEVLADLGIDEQNLAQKKSIEVGNIFDLGTRFSDALGLNFVDEGGKKMPVVMGSYGIGIGRAMGTIVEVLSDAAGIVWPRSVAPFHVHLVSLCREEKNQATAEQLYAELQANGVEVLFDDRAEVRAGEKFADSDLMGIPYRIVVSEKTLEQGMGEVKERTGASASLIPLAELTARSW